LGQNDAWTSMKRENVLGAEGKGEFAEKESWGKTKKRKSGRVRALTLI